MCTCEVLVCVIIFLLIQCCSRSQLAEKMMRYLSIDPILEASLRDLAVDALRAPVPDAFKYKPYINEKGDVFFANATKAVCSHK